MNVSDCVCSVCGIQHLQRGGLQQFSLFNALWYVVVTFSTVGYGDFAPDIWPSKLFMIILIGAAFIVLPTQVCCSQFNDCLSCHVFVLMHRGVLLLRSVREVGVFVDREAEAGRQLQFASSSERASRCCRRHATPRRLHHGLPE